MEGYFEVVVEQLVGAGYRWYETANFCRAGCQARHNLGYWLGRDYLGLGIGAVSTVRGLRWRKSLQKSTIEPMMDAGTPELSPRQEEILVRVVEEHASTGSPVGSKTLVQRSRLEVSSSTVRHELAQLEELGLLSHPHTSAGRVPTDLGYRFFVDRVIEALAPQPADPELSLDFSELRSEVEGALRATTEALAEMTHLLALVSAPPIEMTALRRVEVILLQPQLVLVVVITAAGGVTKRLISFPEPVDSGLAEWAGEYLNERVAGLQLGARLLRNRLEDPQLSPRERAFLAEIRPAFTDVLEAGE